MPVTTLRRSLGLFQLTLYGIGIIIGAGIYAIIGAGAAAAGNAIWISFVIAAAVAALSGLSYAELSGRYPRAAAEYQYVEHAFHRRRISFLVGWIMVFAGIVSSAAVALGFGGYLFSLTGVPIVVCAVGLLGVLSIINFIGIGEASALNTVCSIIEVLGLVIIISIGLPLVGSAAVDYSYSPEGMAGILTAVSLVFFAYLGFENLANMGEEAKHPHKDLPRALLLSLAISTVLYVLTAVAAVAAVGWETLANSPSPLSEVVRVSGIPWLPGVLSVIALFSTGNTVLLMMVAVSRMIFRLSREHQFPRLFGRVHAARRTPYVAIAVVGFASMLLVLPGSLKGVASLTDASVFLGYLAVNIALIALRYREKVCSPGSFHVPGSIRCIPILPVFGAAACIALLLFFHPLVILGEAALLLAGIGFSALYHRPRRPALPRSSASRRPARPQ